MLSHTPFRQLAAKFGHEPVLVAGRGQVRPAAPAAAVCAGACSGPLSSHVESIKEVEQACHSLPCMPTPRQAGAPPAWLVQVREVARHYGFRHVVTTHQLTRAMPAAVPFQ